MERKFYTFRGINYFSSLTSYPDLVHIGNLRGKYFDIRLLSKIASKTSIILRLSDMWICCYYFSFTFPLNFIDGKLALIGRCPDLNLYPSIKRFDGTNK